MLTFKGKNDPRATVTSMIIVTMAIAREIALAIRRNH